MVIDPAPALACPESSTHAALALPPAAVAGVLRVLGLARLLDAYDAEVRGHGRRLVACGPPHKRWLGWQAMSCPGTPARAQLWLEANL